MPYSQWDGLAEFARVVGSPISVLNQLDVEQLIDMPDGVTTKPKCH